jgi:UDP-2-acetamido-3-amino-2,3-dideoxy-glucuronate N-acetyltransferase
MKIHPTAQIDEGAEVAADVIVWGWTHIRERAHLHRGVMIAEHCYIAEGVEIGDNSRVGNGVSIWRGVVIGKRVFVGPHVCFTNDRHPRVNDPKFEPERTFIEDDVSIGAGAVILPVRIGRGAVIGAGSVVTKDIKPGETWMGTPARMVERGVSETGS